MPESWNELSRKQLIAIADILNKEEKSFRDKIYLLRICMGLSAGYFINLGYLPKWLHEKLFLKKIEVLLFLDRSLYLVDFLLQDNLLTNQLISKIKSFYGPADNFQNLRMSEFCYSEFWYLQYKQTYKKEALLNLVATLYRPAKDGYDFKRNPDGDARISFNVNLIAFYANKLAKQRNSELQSVVIWYEGCRANLVNSFPHVFNGKPSETENFGLFSLITNIAEDGVLGDFDKVNDKHVQVVLLRLSELIIRAEKLEEELKANKTA